jgi:phosphotransferase system HPr (HPr) family protein
MIDTEILVINKLGLHARATAKLVTLTAGFKSTIKLGKGSRLIDAKNMMQVMLLGAGKGTVLALKIDGEDEQAALEAIRQLFQRRFDEAE